MNNQKFGCTNCGHHLYDHTYAKSKAVTKKVRKSGIIPWVCKVETCECKEFVPGK